MLTVVIPSYNHEQYILQCLRSACDIDVPDLKILVIDDGSTDNTLQVVRDFIRDEANVPVEVVQKRNSGLISSLNLSLELVGSKFIYICASDDIPVPDGIKFCVSILSKENRCCYIIGGAKKFSAETDSTNAYGENQRYFLNLPPDERHERCFFNYPSPILIQSTLFRTKALKDLGGWDTKLRLDDYPIFIDLLQRYPEIGSDFKYLPDIVTVLYRQHPTNSYKNTFRQFGLVREVIESRAPQALKAKAVANCASSYLITAIKNNRWRDFFLIISSLRYKNIIQIFFYLPLQVLYKLRLYSGRHQR